MGRGKFLSRRDAPPSSQTGQSVEHSRNPLVILGLAFKKMQKLAPKLQPNSLPEERIVSRRPLVDIDDVRKFLREKLAITKDISTIPIPESFSPSVTPVHSHASSNTTQVSSAHSHSFSETTHVSSAHSFSSSPSSLPEHDAASGVGVFDIGTVGHPILELNEEITSPSSDAMEHPTMESSWIVEPPTSNGIDTQAEMEELQQFFRNAGELVGRILRFGLPETSWENKMPWHSPPPTILAKGLPRPPLSFATEEEKLSFYRSARKRKTFLTGCPPTWSFMVANFALLGFLIYNPLG